MTPLRVAVLGAGGTIAPAIVRDLAESEEISDLLLLDLDEARATTVAAYHGGGKARPLEVDARDTDALQRALSDVELLVNSAGYRVNLEAMRACLGAGCHYLDLGAFQLLLSLQDDEALRLYCDSVLGPLEDATGDYGDELIRSLEAFIECNGQWEAAARRLYCHRHTLRYRIRKVEELTGRSLSSARDRIEFWLALRGRDLVEPAA